jgi:hypothetical protein
MGLSFIIELPSQTVIAIVRCLGVNYGGPEKETYAKG